MNPEEEQSVVKEGYLWKRGNNIHILCINCLQYINFLNFIEICKWNMFCWVFMADKNLLYILEAISHRIYISLMIYKYDITCFRYVSNLYCVHHFNNCHIMLLFITFIGEHIKNWRKRYFILRKDGSFLGFRAKPDHGLSDPLNDFTVRGMCSILCSMFLSFCFFASFHLH